MIILKLINAGRYSFDRIDIQSGVCFIQNRQLTIKHQHLEYFALLSLSAGEADIRMTLGIAFIRLKLLHFASTSLWKGNAFTSLPVSAALADFKKFSIVMLGISSGPERKETVPFSPVRWFLLP